MSRIEKFKFALAAMVATTLILPPNLQAQSLDELHKNALKEGGTLNFYGTLAQINAEKILPVFEKRFPGYQGQSRRRDGG